MGERCEDRSQKVVDLFGFLQGEDYVVAKLAARKTSGSTRRLIGSRDRRTSCYSCKLRKEGTHTVMRVGEHASHTSK